MTCHMLDIAAVSWKFVPAEKREDHEEKTNVLAQAKQDKTKKNSGWYNM